MSLTAKVKKIKRQEPLWEGPQSAGIEGGVTQSLMNNYIACHERFRISTMEGLVSADRFEKAIEYGQMWHIAEEYFAKKGGADLWEPEVRKYAAGLVRKYPLQSAEINKWYNVCKVQFPIYVAHWKKHPDQVNRKPLIQEVSFRVPYVLPSGRVVYLRGKWDKVDLVTKEKTVGKWLTDHKTKGDIKPEILKRQLHYDLQTMTYMVALNTLNVYARKGVPDCVDPSTIFPSEKLLGEDAPLQGFYYNVIKRPLSGGKGSIVQYKPSKQHPAGETDKDYYARLHDVLVENVDDYLFRWEVSVTRDEIAEFQVQTLDPLLENMADDYEWWEHCWNTPNTSVFDYTTREKQFPNHRLRHYRKPYGIWDTIAEGGTTDLDDYLVTGQTAGLRRADTLFSELVT